MDRELPPGALGREACAALTAKISAADPKLLAFTSLTAGRRYLGRAAGFGEQRRAHRPNPRLAPAVAIADRGLELGEQHALVADARRPGGTKRAPLTTDTT